MDTVSFTICKAIRYYLPDFVPFQLFWLLLAGLLLIISGILLILKKYVRQIALFIAGMYSLITIFIYLFDSSLEVFFLNLAIIGGLFLMADNNK